MRLLQPIDLVVDLPVPASGFYTDDTMTGPSWTSVQVSRFFFGRQGRVWMTQRVERRLYLDGEQFFIPTRVSDDRSLWLLHDVERFAYALAESGYLAVEQLVRVLEMIRLIAESWGYIDPQLIPVREAGHDPTRREVYAVGTAIKILDDIDGSPGAQERTFSLGDVGYTVHLNDEHWQDLVASLAVYVKIARRGPGRTDDLAKQADRKMIRAWGRKNGYQISDHGRIPIALMDAYNTRRTK